MNNPLIAAPMQLCVAPPLLARLVSGLRPPGLGGCGVASTESEADCPQIGRDGSRGRFRSHQVTRQQKGTQSCAGPRGLTRACCGLWLGCLCQCCPPAGGCQEQERLGLPSGLSFETAPSGRVGGKCASWSAGALRGKSPTEEAVRGPERPPCWLEDGGQIPTLPGLIYSLRLLAKVVGGAGRGSMQRLLEATTAPLSIEAPAAPGCTLPPALPQGEWVPGGWQQPGLRWGGPSALSPPPVWPTRRSLQPTGPAPGPGPAPSSRHPQGLAHTCSPEGHCLWLK